MQYLASGTGLTKAFVYGIAHSAYVDKCTDYKPENVTKYDSIVVHPVTGEVATGQDDWSQLPTIFSSFLLDESVLETDGWFEVPVTEEEEEEQ